MINVRASMNRRVVELADEGVAVLTQRSQGWVDPCYRVEWLDAEVPRGSFKARNVRVHVRGIMGEIDAEARMARLLEALGLKHARSVASADLYDYATSPSDPTKVGTFAIERSPRGVSDLSSPEASPTLRHLVLNLVVVYQ